MTKELLELGLKIKDHIGENDIEERDDFVDSDGTKYSWKIVDDGDWVSEGKYEYSDVVVQVTKGDEALDLFLLQNASRSGSYYSDYYYQYESPDLVERKEKIIKKVYWAKMGSGK